MNKNDTTLSSESMFDTFSLFGLPPLHLLQYHTFYFQNKNQRHWRTRLLKLYDNTCILTGIVASKEFNTTLVGHHLFSRTKRPSLNQNFYNGIIMESTLHQEYHSSFNKDHASVTPDSFVNFINFLKKQEGFFVKTEQLHYKFINKENKLELRKIKQCDNFLILDSKLPYSLTQSFREKGYVFVPFCQRRLEVAAIYVNALKKHLLP